MPKGHQSISWTSVRLCVSNIIHSITPKSSRAWIPASQYGAGTVKVWDRGTWSPVGYPEDGLRNGELELEPKGQRLKVARPGARQTGGVAALNAVNFFRLCVHLCSTTR